MLEYGRLPLSGSDFTRFRSELLKFMIGPHAAACLDRLIEVGAKIAAISYHHGREFGKGEAIYFVIPADKDRVMVMYTDESTLLGADRGSLRSPGDNKLMHYLMEDNLISLEAVAL